MGGQWVPSCPCAELTGLNQSIQWKAVLLYTLEKQGLVAAYSKKKVTWASSPIPLQSTVVWRDTEATGFGFKGKREKEKQRNPNMAK